MDYYPAFLDLRGKLCVVVGGGRTAERKALSLLRSGARVRLISPAVTGPLGERAKRGDILHVKRAYRKGDLRDAFLVIAATSSEETNRRVSEDAPCLVNVVDLPRMANFIVPASVARGPLTIAVSTSGASPAAARAIRRELELLYGSDFGRFLALLRTLRAKAAKDIRDKKQRRSFLKFIGSADTLEVLRKKGFREAKKTVLDKMKEVGQTEKHA